MEVPADYTESARQAIYLYGAEAETYLRYTTVGDPLADAVIDSIADLPAKDRGTVLKSLMDGRLETSVEHIGTLQNFVAEAEREPGWLDRDAMLPGRRMFHRNSEMFLAAFVASVLIEGFCTYISKSFVTTGRLVDQGVKRLQQNNRHLMEIFLPGGLERGGDGWQLSVRIRLVHAQVRRLLRLSDDWDRDAWGEPISTAHLAFAAAVFSGLLLKRAYALGVRPSAEERRSFMQVWRYSAFLMGVPEQLLPTDEETALRLYEVGRACEPPMGFESRVLAHGLINSAPLLVGKTDPHDRKALAHQVYSVSRAMIGEQLADELGYPKTRIFGVLAGVRLRNNATALLDRVFPALAKRHRVSQFNTLIGLSYYDQDGISYRLPDNVYAERDRSF